jgi:hypothetical protein
LLASIEGRSVIVMPIRPTSVALDPEAQKRLGIELFNYVWTLLEKDDRTQRQSDRMVDAAHASRFFWETVGDAVHHARGEWQISRTYATVGRAEPALYHARRCLEICAAHKIGGFDVGYAYEALARAHDLAGDNELAIDYAARAREQAERVTDAEDRELLLSDLATLPG